MKPPKTKTVSKIKKEADKWFSLYIRYRDSMNINGEPICECITCGTLVPLKKIQAGHFQSRRFNSTRFDEQNVHAQCVGCNIMRYGEQYKYAKALDKKYGTGTAELLQRKAQQIHKFTRSELEDIIRKSKAYVAQYER